MKRKTLRILLLTVLIVLATVPNAFAWGPGVHLAVGNYLLANLHLLSPFLGQLLSTHGNAFLYGCLSADIFIGKGSNYTPAHSHNWSTGIKLLNQVQSSELKAYAYGYLSHLAADTIAHNYYVPNMLGSTAPGRGKLSHVFVEMQADMKVDWCRKQAVALFQRPYNAADRSLLTAVDRKKFSFYFKKQIYKQTLSVFERKSLNSSLLFIDKNIPLTGNEHHLNNMLDLSLKVVVDFLRDPLNSPVRTLDPIGSRPLRQVRKLRRNGWSSTPIRTVGEEPHFPVDPRLHEIPSLN